MISLCRSMRRQGIDLLRVYVERAHEQGLEFFPALRMNDGHFAYHEHFDIATGEQVRGPWHSGYASRFWKEHQDLLLHGEPSYWKHLYDYAKEGTRKYRLAQIEEVCRNYDIDGFELDFMRTPHFFKAAEARENGHFMTELVGRVRKMMDQVGEARGKRLRLMATGPRTIAEWEQIGLDVRTWIERGLVDMLVAKSYLYFEQDLPVKQWAAAVKGSDVEFYPCFEVGGETIEAFRAGAARYFRDGADGIYVYNFDFGLPFNALGRQILSEIGDPRLLAGQDKQYCLLGGGVCAGAARVVSDSQTPACPVPATIDAGASHRFDVDIADDVPDALRDGSLGDVTLEVVSGAQSGKLAFSLNGEPLEPSLWKVRENVWRAVLDQPAMKAGLNTLAVDNHGDAAVTVSSVQVFVRYKGSRLAAVPAERTARDTRDATETGPWKLLESRCPSMPIILSREQCVNVIGRHRTRGSSGGRPDREVRISDASHERA